MASKANIKKELIKQLSLKRANIDPFLSLIDDYLDLWSIKNALIKDIKANGSVLVEIDHEGVEHRGRNNPSVKELVGVNKQMLSILKELGLSTANVGGDEDDDL